jgi:hypothetical protein
MDDDAVRITRTNGVTSWRAGCGESRTSGSEGGPEKPTDRNVGKALRSDPYTQHRTPHGLISSIGSASACYGAIRRIGTLVSGGSFQRDLRSRPLDL